MHFSGVLNSASASSTWPSGTYGESTPASGLRGGDGAFANDGCISKLAHEDSSFLDQRMTASSSLGPVHRYVCVEWTVM
jgi:hypothetical protein